jgi:anti-anti-sigma factor
MHPPPHTAPTVEDLLTTTVTDLTPDTILCTVHGDIDAATSPHLQHTLTDLLHRAPTHLVIDLTQVDFMASIGLHLLAHTHHTQHTAGHHLTIITGHNYAVTRPLHITGLDHTLELHTHLLTATPQTHPPITTNRNPVRQL